MAKTAHNGALYAAFLGFLEAKILRYSVSLSASLGTVSRFSPKPQAKDRSERGARSSPSPKGHAQNAYIPKKNYRDKSRLFFDQLQQMFLGAGAEADKTNTDIKTLAPFFTRFLDTDHTGEDN